MKPPLLLLLLAFAAFSPPTTLVLGLTPIAPVATLTPSLGAGLHAATTAALRPLPLLLRRSEPLALLAGGANLIHYHRSMEKREQNGEATWRSSLAEARRRWARHVFDDEGWLYAIQTLRNAITANTFLASTVLSLFSLAAGYLLQQSRALPRDVAHLGMLLPMAPILTLLLLSAFNFSQSARVMTHAGFMFPVASDAPKETSTAVSYSSSPASVVARDVITKEGVESLMVKSEYQQWRGLRFLYLA